MLWNGGPVVLQAIAMGRWLEAGVTLIFGDASDDVLVVSDTLERWRKGVVVRIRGIPVTLCKGWLGGCSRRSIVTLPILW
jgi:hypothetical protein